MKNAISLTAALAGLTLVAAGLAPALAQEGHTAPPVAQNISRAQAEDLYNQRCASCHNGAVERAPPRAQMAQRAPEDLIHVMTDGAMRIQAAGLNEVQIKAIAVLITGKEPLPKTAEGPDANLCPKADPIRFTKVDWNGWSLDKENSRHQPTPGLKAADVAKLKPKWTFAYAGSKNGQATIIGDRLFVSSNAGKIYSLNAKTGCVYWRHDSKGGVRTSAIVEKNAKSPSGAAVYFGDDRMSVKALDAMTGKQIWTVKVDDHPRAVITGTPILYKGVLYVPTSSMEETVTTESAYSCCTFRGAIVAIDVKTGQILWKTYMIDDAPRPHRVSQGKQLFGPAGAAIWSTPTVDAKRGLLYVATGDSYTDVATKTTDAVVALNLADGKVRWVNQVTENDNFIVGCPNNNSPNRPANCPQVTGPDWDFGASVILKTQANGKQIILAGQKSGVIYGMDPDNNGKTVWEKKLGHGGALGGIEWGIAADKDHVYVPMADQFAPADKGRPGITALTFDGKEVWHVAADKAKCSWTGGRCSPGYSAAATSIPGVVFQGSLDGHLRAFDAKTGAKVWDFDTAAGAYETVNGVKGAKGGPVDATGPTIANGMLFQHSGYSGYGGSPNGQNLLIAFSVDGK